MTTLSRYKRHAQAFVVATSKNPGLDTASERTIELINNALADNISVNDPDSWPVCSTRFFGNVAPGSRTFYFLGSKDSTSVENTLILGSSMRVSCTDSLGLESTDSSSEENAFPTDEHESSDEEESSRSEPVQTLKEAGRHSQRPGSSFGHGTRESSSAFASARRDGDNARWSIHPCRSAATSSIRP